MTKVGQEVVRTRTEVKKMISQFRNHGEELETEGVAVDETIAELNKELASLDRLAAKAERVRKQQARARAQIARDDTEYFEVVCKVLNALAKECPQHPLVREWIEIRRLWRAQMVTRN